MKKIFFLVSLVSLFSFAMPPVPNDPKDDWVYELLKPQVKTTPDGKFTKNETSAYYPAEFYYAHFQPRDYVYGYLHFTAFYEPVSYPRVFEFDGWVVNDNNPSQWIYMWGAASCPANSSEVVYGTLHGIQCPIGQTVMLINGYLKDIP